MITAIIGSFFSSLLWSIVFNGVLIFGLLYLIKILLKSKNGKMTLLISAVLLLGFYGGTLYKQREVAHLEVVHAREIQQIKEDYANELERIRQESAKQLRDMQERKDQAIADAQKRADGNRRAADGANAELVRLRKQVSGINERVRRASEAAVREYAIAANSVFEQCSERLVTMARISDGHANDVRMMLAAWPRRREDDLFEGGD